MACYITYGPISLENVLIKSIKCDTVLGDDGYTRLYKKYTIMFAAHCNGRQNGWKFPNRNGLGDRSAFTAETLLQWLSQPHQYFRLEYNNIAITGPSGRPGPGQKVDPGMGPRCYGIQISNVAGELGYSSEGGYFLVSGTFEVCSPFGEGSNGYIRGYSIGCDHDVDGDTRLTTITTSITLYGVAENIRSREADGQQSIWVGFGEVKTLLESTPPGFKRRRAKTQVLPGATEARIVFIDTEMQLPLGSESPATLFEPSQTEVSRVDEKGGGAGCMTIITINAACPKDVNREVVIRQMLNWIIIKGQGGQNGRAGAPGANARFVCYREIVMAVDYAGNRLQLTAKIQKQISINGVGGMPFSLADTELNTAIDYGKIDQWGVPYRNFANGEPNQGTQRDKALSPALSYNGTAGSYVADILRDAIVHGLPENNRQLPDGNASFCGAGSANLPLPADDTTYGLSPGEAIPVEVEVGDIDLPDLSLGWLYLSGVTYESSWMQTKYDTDKGTMVLPTGGAMPGGTGDPPAKRVQLTVHEGTTVKVVHWGIQALSATAPIYPSSTPTDKNQILVKQKINPAAVNPIGGGMYAWTITGTYWYECLVLVEPGNTLGIGLLPITPGVAADYNISGGQARTGYLPG